MNGRDKMTRIKGSFYRTGISIFFLLLTISLGAVPVQSAPAARWAAHVATQAVSYPGELRYVVILADPRIADPAQNLANKALYEQYLLQAPEKTANIEVNYVNVSSWPDQAKAAFDYAKGIWETLIPSTVMIKIEARWEDLGSTSILGGSQTANAWANFPNAPIANTWYPNALANKLASSDIDPGPDILASFNSTFSNWYFGTDGNPPFGKYDFVTVVLHEIAHGLGFAGTMSVGGFYCGNSSWGCWGFGVSPQYPMIYDRFVTNGSNSYLIDVFQNYSTDLAAQLQSNNLIFHGENAKAGNNGNYPKLYAPSSWQQGSSYSHLDTSFDGTLNALMTWSLSSGEVHRNPGPVTMGIFKDLGWNYVPFHCTGVCVFLPAVGRGN